MAAATGRRAAVRAITGAGLSAGARRTITFVSLPGFRTTGTPLGSRTTGTARGAEPNQVPLEGRAAAGAAGRGAQTPLRREAPFTRTGRGEDIERVGMAAGDRVVTPAAGANAVQLDRGDEAGLLVRGVSAATLTRLVPAGMDTVALVVEMRLARVFTLVLAATLPAGVLALVLATAWSGAALLPAAIETLAVGALTLVVLLTCPVVTLAFVAVDTRPSGVLTLAVLVPFPAGTLTLAVVAACTAGALTLADTMAWPDVPTCVFADTWATDDLVLTAAETPVEPLTLVVADTLPAGVAAFSVVETLPLDTWALAVVDTCPAGILAATATCADGGLACTAVDAFTAGAATLTAAEV